MMLEKNEGRKHFERDERPLISFVCLLVYGNIGSMWKSLIERSMRVNSIKRGRDHIENGHDNN